MNFNELLIQQNITKYRLSKISGVPFATISDISTGKATIEKCSAGTLYKLAKSLDVTMEDLIADSIEYRSSFETYKSNVCHRVHDMGDMDFIIDTLESDNIRKLYQKRWYPESLYLLAMVDYLSRENNLPACGQYSDIRKTHLREPIFPASIIAMSAASRSEYPKQDSFDRAIPEFKRFNIVESDVRNVC
jgi:DNA-binding Xre family transcriptional regulator